jgi:hypothetical protein
MFLHFVHEFPLHASTSPPPGMVSLQVGNYKRKPNGKFLLIFIKRIAWGFTEDEVVLVVLCDK